jgi:hypothetical protein
MFFMRCSMVGVLICIVLCRFSVHVLHDPWEGQPLPPGSKIPEKPLVSKIPKLGGKKEQCTLQ